VLEYREQLKQEIGLKFSLFSQGNRKLCGPDVHYEDSTEIIIAETWPKNENHHC